MSINANANMKISLTSNHLYNIIFRSHNDMSVQFLVSNFQQTFCALSFTSKPNKSKLNCSKSVMWERILRILNDVRVTSTRESSSDIRVQNLWWRPVLITIRTCLIIHTSGHRKLPFRPGPIAGKTSKEHGDEQGRWSIHVQRRRHVVDFHDFWRCCKHDVAQWI